MKTAVRVSLFPADADVEPRDYAFCFDVVVENGRIIPRLPFFGCRGFVTADDKEAVILLGDGLIDFCNGENPRGRFEVTNLREREIRIGGQVSVWDGPDRKASDEFLYVIRRVEYLASALGDEDPAASKVTMRSEPALAKKRPRRTSETR